MVLLNVQYSRIHNKHGKKKTVAYLVKRGTTENQPKQHKN